MFHSGFRSGFFAFRRRAVRPCPANALRAGARAAAAAGLCLCLTSPTPARAQDEGELAELKGRIAEGETALDKVRRGEASVLEVLDGIEADLERRTRRLATLNTRLERREREVDEAARAAAAAAAALEQGRRALAGRVRALYKWQRSGTPFVLLNGDLSLPDLMRRKHLLETVVGRDRELVRRLADELRQSRDLRGTVEARRRALARERDEGARQRDELKGEQARKQAALRTLRRERKLRAQALEELRLAARRVGGIIQGSAARRAGGADTAAVDGADTAAADGAGGALELPVSGMIVSGFGIHKHPDLDVDVHRPGIDIAAPAGAGVRAVEGGRVLFANRLPGYGKMLILDHGGRYYTVYGHLSELAKSVGDRVARGERIARVRDDLSSGRSRLYFEMRRNGKPVDPLPWFGRGRAAAGGKE